ncbi:DUF411 domain-containing protein [uncultured Maricaulis sp.]|uniref:DUF411 domain-containing protein n=1 Tax=uncultured Maricaulis sp. TaxID=174710 RepID=UPI0030DAFD92|tara:strand:- start:19971 stop:20423 length:453 start_codon:yes stop_codon:yes gene_type:complete
MINRRQALLGGIVFAGSPGLIACSAQANPSVLVYKSPTCGCCNAWIAHLRESGFEVEPHDLDDMTVIKQRLTVPQEMWSCHTAIVENYVVEGHVPAAEITRMLAERPTIRGLAVPGMPAGSPGMEVPGYSQAYTVWSFGDAGRAAFAQYG